MRYWLVKIDLSDVNLSYYHRTTLFRRCLGVLTACEFDIFEVYKKENHPTQSPYLLIKTYVASHQRCEAVAELKFSNLDIAKHMKFVSLDECELNLMLRMFEWPLYQ